MLLKIQISFDSGCAHSKASHLISLQHTLQIAATDSYPKSPILQYRELEPLG